MTMFKCCETAENAAGSYTAYKVKSWRNSPYRPIFNIKINHDFSLFCCFSCDLKYLYGRYSTNISSLNRYTRRIHTKAKLATQHGSRREKTVGVYAGLSGLEVRRSTST
jgi:hypothetical protein